MTEEEWSLSVISRQFWQKGCAPAGSVVILTAEERLVMTRYASLSVHPRQARPGERVRRSVLLVGWERVAVGKPWLYRHRDGELISETVTSPVEEIWEVSGALSDSLALSTPVGEASTRRTEASEVWLEETIGARVTVLVTTIGTWDGVWMITDDGSGHRFIPADPAAPVLTWNRVLTSSWVRLGHSLWLNHSIAPGVWSPIDPAGCGTVIRIVVEELDSSGSFRDFSE